MPSIFGFSSNQCHLNSRIYPIWETLTFFVLSISDVIPASHWKRIFRWYEIDHWMNELMNAKLWEAFLSALSASRYHPSKGYWWQFSDDAADTEENKASKKPEETGSIFQCAKVDRLLENLTRQYPHKFYQASWYYSFEEEFCTLFNILISSSFLRVSLENHQFLSSRMRWRAWKIEKLVINRTNLWNHRQTLNSKIKATQLY